MTDKEKVKYVKTIFPKLSERGQKYLQRLAEAMLVVQKSALSPIQSELVDDQCETLKTSKER
jgi:hypothetical protein